MKAKFISDFLNEELVGRYKYTLRADHDPIEVYKNPKSIKRMSNELKGISTEAGDLYVFDGTEVTHEEMASWMVKHGYLPPSGGWVGSKRGTFAKCVAWTRQKGQNIFVLSESYFFIRDIPEEEFEYMEKLRDRVKNKNPQYEFKLEPII